MILPDPASLAVFVSSTLVLLIVPGPAVLYIVTRSFEQGRLAGVVSTLGIAAGSLVHVVAAVLGLSAVIASSAAAFAVLKYVGAAYLVFLGLRTLRDPVAGAGAARLKPRRLRRLFVDGFVVNALNPKAALFFLAFLPQFVDPGRGPALPQVLFLAGLFLTLAIASDMTYALAASQARTWLLRSPRVLRAQKRLSGATYIGLGLLTAVSRRSS